MATYSSLWIDLFINANQKEPQVVNLYYEPEKINDSRNDSRERELSTEMLHVRD